MGTHNIDVTDRFFRDIGDRTREVVLVVRRPGGRILTTTKGFYPPGIYRIPTGGINVEEEPDAGFARELYEETGFTSECPSFLGEIHYAFRNGGRTHEFTSYVYMTEEIGAAPEATDPNEGITEYRDVPVDELPKLAEALRGLGGRWADWGAFRAPAHDFVYRKLAG